MLSQLGISITATVVATLILAGAQYELAALRPSAPVPDLTSGGKFAARVEVLRAAAADDDMIQSPPVPPVPLLAASNTLLTLPMPFAAADRSIAAGPAEASKAPKRVVRAEPHRRSPAELADIVPPKRSDAVGIVGVASTSDAAQASTAGLWSTTKTVTREALGIGATILDLMNPLNLIP